MERNPELLDMMEGEVLGFRCGSVGMGVQKSESACPVLSDRDTPSPRLMLLGSSTQAPQIYHDSWLCGCGQSAPPPLELTNPCRFTSES